MPVVFRDKGFRFFFYSNEGNPREPAHVHVIRDAAEAKFWLYPTPHIAYDHGFDARTLVSLLKIVDNRRDDIERAWNEHFA